MAGRKRCLLARKRPKGEEKWNGTALDVKRQRRRMHDKPRQTATLFCKLKTFSATDRSVTYEKTPAPGRCGSRRPQRGAKIERQVAA